jgi:prolyl oligopeptidase
VRLYPGLGVIFLLASAAGVQMIHGRGGITLPPPPKVQKIPVTDDYFGTKIVDDYRWLEDAKSPATQAFINAENAYTTRYMDQARIRPQVVNQLEALENVETWTIPIQRGDDYFFEKRLAGTEQSAIYMRHGWTGKDRLLVDPAQFSRDPNTSVDLLDVSRDGALAAYGVRQGGADQNTVRLFNVKTGKVLFDELPSGLYWSVNFTPDGKGLFYARGNQQGTLVYEHVLGTRNADDKLIFGREFYGEPLGPLDLITTAVSDDGRYLVVEIDRGVPAKRVDIVYRDLARPDSPFSILVWGVDSRFSTIEAGGAWYVMTDYKAPNGRILKAYPGIMPDVWQTIVPQGQSAIENFSIVGNKIYVQRLHDVKTEIAAYTLAGKPAGSLSFEGMGAASAIQGRTIDRYGFYSFESYIEPPVIYRLDTVTDRKEVFAKPRIPFDTSQYELKQVFYTSKDGTRVPMFIAGKKGLKQDGTERLLMTGYGGFDISMTPGWNPAWAWWIEQGGWFALPNLRGGGEYGEEWHQAGMFGKKQNVFDDFYAAARYLIANKYTSPQHFAITGRSNGGLLMGAAMTQQPQLFAAVVCGYPLLDMLRYQRFEQGVHWTTEYGSSDNEDQFKYLLKYSPYQNVKKGVDYPAVLFFTGASDTRVDPLHARKMTALMQADSASGRPILLHYGMDAGHSEGVGVQQKVQDDADQLTFLWTESGPVTAHQ